MYQSYNLNNSQGPTQAQYNNQETPYSDRILKISQKLASIQTGSDNERVQKLDTIEQRLKALEDQFQDFQDQVAKKTNGLKENVVRIHRVIEEDRINKEQLYEIKMKELTALDSKFTVALENEINSRRETENKFVRLIEDKVSLVRSEIVRETKIRNETIENLNQCLELDLQKLQDELKTEAFQREENDQNIMKNLTEQLLKLNNSIQQDRKLREDSEQQIFDTLREVVNRVKTEIEYERKNRESSEETILNLLEDTCNKLNSATLV